MADASPLIVASGLWKVFPLGRGPARRDLVAVEDVTFTVGSGECLGIVGESGSGKTTVARMLLGLVGPTAGRVAVAGRDRSRPTRSGAERRRRGRELQFVPQDPYSSLDPRQSARACLGEVLRLHQGRAARPARASRIDELLERVGLDDRQSRALPRHLSGGQCQRIAIARALAAQPAAVILDEAVSGLDVSIQAQILNLLADIRRATGVSYVFISHDLAVIRQIADHVIVMRQGRVVEAGPAALVLDAPQHPYTRELRRSVPGPGWQPPRRTATSAVDERPDS